MIVDRAKPGLSRTIMFGDISGGSGESSTIEGGEVVGSKST